MREFLHRWRRKVGVVTLVMACVLMTAWIRSHVITEIIFEAASDSEFMIAAGDVLWSRTTMHLERDGDRRQSNLPCGWSWESMPYRPEILEPPLGFQKSVSRSLPGFEISIASKNRAIDGFDVTIASTKWTMTLLWPILVLAILSAYLILWQPRKRSSPI